MTIVNASQVDKAMGRFIDPKSVPTHIGGSRGAMEENFVAQSATRITDQGTGKRGAAEYDPNELPDSRFYGSATVISVNDAPPLEAAHEPPPQAPVVPAPTEPRSVAELLARMGLK
jgi:hypothetical protein